MGMDVEPLVIVAKHEGKREENCNEIDKSTMVAMVVLCFLEHWIPCSYHLGRGVRLRK